MNTRSDAADGAFWGDIDRNTALSRYQTLVDTLDDGIYQLNPAGRFVAVNDTVLEMTGYTRDDLLGEHVSLLLDDADIDQIKQEIAAQLDSPTTDSLLFELAVRTADGETISCEVRLNILIEDDEFHGTVGIVRELSTKQQHLRTLQSAQDSYNSLTSVINEANVGIAILTEDDEIAWVDKTIEQYFGQTRDEILGRQKEDILRELPLTCSNNPSDSPKRFSQHTNQTVISIVLNAMFFPVLTVRNDGLNIRANRSRQDSTRAGASNSTTILLTRSAQNPHYRRARKRLSH